MIAGYRAAAGSSAWVRGETPPARRRRCRHQFQCRCQAPLRATPGAGSAPCRRRSRAVPLSATHRQKLVRAVRRRGGILLGYSWLGDHRGHFVGAHRWGGVVAVVGSWRETRCQHCRRRPPPAPDRWSTAVPSQGADQAEPCRSAMIATCITTDTALPSRRTWRRVVVSTTRASSMETRVRATGSGQAVS